MPLIQKQMARALAGIKRLRRPPRPVAPLSIERHYLKQLKIMIAYMKHLVDQDFIPKLSHYAAQAHKAFPNAKKRSDAVEDYIGDLVKIQLKFSKIYTPSSLRQLALGIATNTSEFNKKNVQSAQF
jgi:hypothetical protein